jgi:hypothetical protein
MYASTMGRWMSPDPSNLGADLYMPQTLNKYNYAVNNPWNCSQCSAENGAIRSIGGMDGPVATTKGSSLSVARQTPWSVLKRRTPRSQAQPDASALNCPRCRFATGRVPWEFGPASTTQPRPSAL